MNKKELIKRDDLIYLIEKIDQYLYTDDAGDSDNIKWNKDDILTHADIILKHYNLRYVNSSVYYDVENDTHKVLSFIQDLNTSEIVVRYEYTVDAYNYNTTTNDVSNRTLTDLHKLLTNYMDYFYKNVEEFNICDLIKDVEDTRRLYLSKEDDDKHFIIDKFNEFDKICKENGIFINYIIKHINSFNININAEYISGGYLLTSSDVSVLRKKYIAEKICYAKLYCMRDVLDLIIFNGLK